MSMTRVLRGVVGLLVVTLVGGSLLLLGRSALLTRLLPSLPPVCPAVAAVKVGTISVPAGPVAGFCQDRLINAAHIVNAARALGIGQHTQAIGVMTAIGESGLVNLDHGDAAGADSRGLFQQRANGAWGSLADRMTPYTAAYDFFAALVAIPSWKTLSPTQAAHAVQANADPTYYSQYWSRAVAVVTVLNR
ncbi:MAG: hypothetical protein HIU86_01325 [Acidobacteria bacterium]|nr:hypothetical protein [Acidobacteriota bacterium]